jgi:6-phosphogluconolactonase (cycloisomerase 2 family)
MKPFNGGKSLAIATFGGAETSGIPGGLSIFQVADTGAISYTSHYNYNDTLKGPNPGQPFARAHSVYPDPSGKFLVVMDYGADKVRSYKINGTNLIPGDVIYLNPGTGPRHATFFSHNATSQTYLFILSEFLNTITTVNVTYNDRNGTMGFSEISRVTGTFGGNTIPKAKAAEIRVSPDNRFVTVSNRNDSSFWNGASDSLATYSVNADGSLKFVQLAPAGGLFPRTFQFNKAGDKVVVALQTDSKIAVLSRDVNTGLIGNVTASLAFNTTTVDGKVAGIPAAIWDE